MRRVFTMTHKGHVAPVIRLFERAGSGTRADQYESDGFKLARRLGAQVTVAQHLAVKAWAIVTINFDGVSCGANGPTHGDQSYLGALHVCDPHAIIFGEPETRLRIAVAGAVADLLSDNTHITDAEVHARMSVSDCVLGVVQTVIMDPDFGYLKAAADVVVELLRGELADEWENATHALRVLPDEFEAVYPLPDMEPNR
jgi:hypothetical protein